MNEAKQSNGKLRTNELEMNEQEMSEAEVLFEMNRKLPRMQILSEAGVVIFERGTDYGPVAENWERTAKILNGILGAKLNTPLSAADVGMVMIGVKLARLTNAPDHRDTQVDIAGYAALMSEVA
tara:strand:- start:134 stop:505 length:372 start_codon:yes stop_codon:yes gene_type:complete